MSRRGGHSSAGSIQLLPFLDILTCTMGCTGHAAVRLRALWTAAGRQGQRCQAGRCRGCRSRRNRGSPVACLDAARFAHQDRGRSRMGPARIEPSGRPFATAPPACRRFTRPQSRWTIPIPRLRGTRRVPSWQKSRSESHSRSKNWNKPARTPPKVQQPIQSFLMPAPTKLAAGRSTSSAAVKESSWNPKESSSPMMISRARSDRAIRWLRRSVPHANIWPRAIRTRSTRSNPIHCWSCVPTAFRNTTRRTRPASFGSQFGYELIGADKKLKFPEADPQHGRYDQQCRRRGTHPASATDRSRTQTVSQKRKGTFSVKSEGGGLDAEPEPQVRKTTNEIPTRDLADGDRVAAKGTEQGTGVTAMVALEAVVTAYDYRDYDGNQHRNRNRHSHRHRWSLCRRRKRSAQGRRKRWRRSARDRQSDRWRRFRRLWRRWHGARRIRRRRRSHGVGNAQRDEWSPGRLHGRR